MAKNSAGALLSSLDDLFSTQEEREVAKRPTVQEIPIDLIDEFPDHPFKVRADDSMQEMVDSVRQHGVLVPAIVRRKPDGRYEMVAGHRRKAASELAERTEIPCIVHDLTDEEATVIMVDSNLQREQILPSEKAFAYKMKLEAMKRQAGRPTKDNYSPVGNNFSGKTSSAIMAESVGESKNQIFRFIRLTNLIPELLEMVDNSVLKEKGSHQIAMRPAVELSYLTVEQQKNLHETILTEESTPSHAQALKMRQLSQQGRLGMDAIFSIMLEEKPNQKDKVNISRERISKFFAPDTSPKQIEDTIVKALEMYRKRSRDDRGR